MEKKKRSDAWESRIPDELQSRVYLAAGRAKNFHEAKLVISQEFPELKLPSERSFYRFLDRMRNNAAMLVQRAAAAARDVRDMASTTKFERTDLIASFQTLAAEAEFAGDHDRAKELFDVVFSLARLDQKDEELRIAKDKFEAAERRLAATEKTVGDEKLTDEQRVVRIKEIFGLK